MKKLFTLLLAAGALAPSVAMAADDGIIENPPAGAKELTFCRCSMGLYMSALGSLDNYSYYGYEQKLYEVGDEVYLQNPISPFLMDTYIKGTKTVTGYEFKLPQPLYHYVGVNETTGEPVDEIFDVNLFYLDPSGDYLPDNQDPIIYALDLQPDGSYKFDYGEYHVGSSGFMGSYYYTDLLLGLQEKSTGEWLGYSELSCRLIPFDPTETIAPADLQTKTYQFVGNDNGYTVRIGTTENEFYIQGFLDTAPNRWIKGEFDGKKAKIKSNQFLGTAGGQTIFLAGAMEIEQGTTKIPAATEYLELNYDEATDTWTPEDLIWFNLTPRLDYDDSYALFLDATFKPEPQYLNPVPKAPTIDADRFMNYDRYMEMGRINFTISALNLKNDVLPTDRLEYALFIDDELYWLDPADYSRLEEEMSWIPYNFDDGWDILVYPFGNRTVFFYAQALEDVQVQVRYKDDNGEYHYSTKAIIDKDGILNVADLKFDGDVVSEACYDLTGRRVGADHKGVTLRVHKMADGSQRTLKTVK